MRACIVGLEIAMRKKRDGRDHSREDDDKIARDDWRHPEALKCVLFLLFLHLFSLFKEAHSRCAALASHFDLGNLSRLCQYMVSLCNRLDVLVLAVHRL